MFVLFGLNRRDTEIAERLLATRSFEIAVLRLFISAAISFHNVNRLKEKPSQLTQVQIKTVQLTTSLYSDILTSTGTRGKESQYVNVELMRLMSRSSNTGEGWSEPLSRGCWQNKRSSAIFKGFVPWHSISLTR